MSLFDRRKLLLTGAAAAFAGPAFAYEVPEDLQPRIVEIKDGFRAGEIHVDPGQFALYWTLPDGKALRYSVGIGTQERYHSGTFRIRRKAEWPSWTPTPAMIRREPELYKQHAGGMKGGGINPLGARALYLYKGDRDTYLRIHGTPKPQTVAARVSNGCVRMINEHVIDLYNRVPTGTRVVLH
ncbi:L,D-transpeptidase [Sulfitobacter guttiformis]|uniref:L,D-transpeptidase-like protein n=1 Tax=Sulfitobacter guttiformis TaxID=74349 RepID=A0A420DT26_9RHOB|nr:L,D-transpeptidase [Sulfitobacter guttiformis]KIN74743.1 ErfK/YbiS/YcfS/YnhG family protein [Sulfitobacter guttiformis KCTC 32187]RKE97318.1 L,D-transpeptidase-like protein [Sulfitobacter guttiformis]